MGARLLAAGALLALSFGVAPAAPDAAGESAPAPAPPLTEDELRFEELTESFVRAAEEARADPSFDEVLLIEAEEIAAVAHELLAEGETNLAVRLLEGAVALLEPPTE